MAIRGTTPNPLMPTSTPSTTPDAGVPQQLQRTLSDNGLLSAGQNPTQVLQQLVGTLTGKGFAAQNQLPLLAQFRQLLSQLQQANGRPPTGQLDAQTASLLKELLVNLKPSDQVAGKKDGFTTSNQQAIQQTLGNAVDKDTLRALTDGIMNLFGGSGDAAGSFLSGLATSERQLLEQYMNKPGALRASEKSDPNKNLSKNDKSANADDKSKNTGAANSNSKLNKKADEKLEKLKKNADKQQVKQQQADETLNQAAYGLLAKNQKAQQARRQDGVFKGDLSAQPGILDEEAEDDEDTTGDDDGNGKGRNKRQGQGQEQQEQQEQEKSADNRDGAGGADGTTNGAAGSATGDEAGSDGRAGGAGNAFSGSKNAKDSDTRRSHGFANWDGTGGDPDGYWSPPILSEQMFMALQRVQRDTLLQNRARTYSWDFTFVKPGVYRGGQKAEEILHLVVKSATAFDPVWQRACDVLCVLAKKYAPHEVVHVPTVEDVIAAIRQARVREGENAADVGPVQLPRRA